MKKDVILSVVVLNTLLFLLIPVGVHAERKIVWITGYTEAFKYTGRLPHGMDRNMTSTGGTSKFGVVSADPEIIPFFSYIHIPGFANTFIVEDSNAGVKGNHIEVYLPTEKEVKDFGTKRATIEVERVPFKSIPSGYPKYRGRNAIPEDLDSRLKEHDYSDSVPPRYQEIKSSSSPVRRFPK